MKYTKLWVKWDRCRYSADPKNWEELNFTLTNEEQFMDRDPNKRIPQTETDEIMNILK